MAYQHFEEIATLVKENSNKKKVALVRAEDVHSMEAIADVVKQGILDAVYIGNREEIKQTASTVGLQISDEQIFDAADPEDAAAKGVELIKSGKADFLMKGKLETSEMLRPIVKKETGLSKGGVMSHVAVNEIPAYHKLLITTDGGMMPYPNVQQKKCIIENAVEVFHKLGYENPKVGVLAAMEKPNPKMPETMDAQALKEMNLSGEIAGCTVEGPISLDLALVKERSVVKGYESPCAGDTDILIVPNVHAGNMLGKSLVEMAHAKMAGLVMGAQCPVVLTSRGSSAEEKLNSLLLACIVSNKEAC